MNWDGEQRLILWCAIPLLFAEVYASAHLHCSTTDPKHPWKTNQMGYLEVFGEVFVFEEFPSY
jgi:hypothetical protein